MGFFDRFRKTVDRGERGNSLLQEMIAIKGLKRMKPYEPSIEQDWWEGYYGTMRFALQEHGRGLRAYLGDIVEVTEIYLGRMHPDIPIPPNSPQRLDRIVGAEGTELAEQFVLLAYPQGAFDYPQLRIPGLLRGIPLLSASVEEISIYENYRGLSLIMKPPLLRTYFDNDLRIGSEILKALS